jgi:hypothetical protein
MQANFPVAFRPQLPAEMAQLLSDAHVQAAEAGPLAAFITRGLTQQRITLQLAEQNWRTLTGLQSLSLQPAQQLSLMTESMEMQVAIQQRLNKLYQDWMSGLTSVTRTALGSQFVNTADKLVEGDMNTVLQFASLWVNQLTALTQLAQNIQVNTGLIVERHLPKPKLAD